MLVNSCGIRPNPSKTNNPQQLTVTLIEPSQQPVSVNCHPATVHTEVNKSQTKGVGPGYSHPPDSCSVFCYWVDEGNLLTIGITDLFSDLNLYIAKNFITNWDYNGPETIDNNIILRSDNPGTQNEEIIIKDPEGFYYAWVCGDGLMRYMSQGDTSIIETDAAQFTLYSKLIQ